MACANQRKERRPRTVVRVLPVDEYRHSVGHIARSTKPRQFTASRRWTAGSIAQEYRRERIASQRPAFRPGGPGCAVAQAARSLGPAITASATEPPSRPAASTASNACTDYLTDIHISASTPEPRPLLAPDPQPTPVAENWTPTSPKWTHPDGNWTHYPRNWTHSAEEVTHWPPRVDTSPSSRPPRRSRRPEPVELHPCTT